MGLAAQILVTGSELTWDYRVQVLFPVAHADNAVICGIKSLAALPHQRNHSVCFQRIFRHHLGITLSLMLTNHVCVPLQIFTPPYLLTGTPQPRIIACPAVVNHGQTFTVRFAIKPSVIITRCAAFR